jgi:hypothetical protein
MTRVPKAKTAAEDFTANFAWAQHSTRHLAPKDMAGGKCRAAFKIIPALEA